ncbi:MAG: hypothetical protein ACOX62_04505 [Christensenellales bacterium]|jgi:hypothetical protein
MIRKAGRKDLGAVAGPALKLWPHSGEPALMAVNSPPCPAGADVWNPGVMGYTQAQAHCC